jgi:hypothetical protein
MHHPQISATTKKPPIAISKNGSKKGVRYSTIVQRKKLTINTAAEAHTASVSARLAIFCLAGLSSTLVGIEEV